MSAPLVPSPLDCVGVRRFAFYPPLDHPDPNEWMLGSGSRSEIEVVNARTGRGLWIARQHIGAVSETEESLLVVGLTQALNCKGATAEPRVKRVIQMPTHVAPGETPASERRSRPASVITIRLEKKQNRVMNRALASACTGAIVIALLAALITAAIKF